MKARATGSSTVIELLDEHFRSAGLGEDRGYSDRWVDIRFGPLMFSIPNTPGRIRLAKLHDVHHLVTGYRMDLRGEAEIAAWELGAGCGDYGTAWVLALSALPYGALVEPCRLLRAFARGRQSQNLYHLFDGDYAALMNQSVRDIRDRLGLATPTPPRPGVTDAAQLTALLALAAPVTGLTGIVGLAATVWRRVSGSY